jgi:hypothetical protein
MFVTKNRICIKIEIKKKYKLKLKMFHKHDFLFFYFLLLLRSNMKIMSNIRSFLTKQKHVSFSLFDALLIYYYLVIGLQCDTALKYIEFYVRTYDCMKPYRILTPLLKN